MFNRPIFWFGLLLGGFTSYESVTRTRPRQLGRSANELIAFVDDAQIVCDASGAIIQINPTAQTLFGTKAAGLFRLCYPTGQAIPPGQLPLRLALLSGQVITSEGYRIEAADGSSRILDITARPISGGAAAIFRDVTALHHAVTREGLAYDRQQSIRRLSRRLTETSNVEVIGQVLIQEFHALIGSSVEAQLRLYLYNPAAQTLTCIASLPEGRGKRPKVSAEISPFVCRFDAQLPGLWQLYVGRQPFTGILLLPGDYEAASSLALPLLAGSVVIGHIALTSPDYGVFEGTNIRDGLETLASIAGLALAGPQDAKVAATLSDHAAAIREIAQFLSHGGELSSLADLVTTHVKRGVGAEVCILWVPKERRLTAAGELYRDDLLFPERLMAADPALQGKAVQKAWRTQKTVGYAGLQNPPFEAGPWRAFSGKSGLNSVLALPLISKRGVLAVYCNGAVPLADAHVKFLETVAALIGLSLPAATDPKAPSDS